MSKSTKPKPHKKNKMQSIKIVGQPPVSLKEIDERIISDGMWAKMKPPFITITVPKEAAEEILNKLRSYPSVDSARIILKQKKIHLNCIGNIDFKSIDKDIVCNGWTQGIPNEAVLSVPKNKVQTVITKLREHPNVCGIEGELFSDRWPKVHVPESVRPDKQELEKISAYFTKLKHKKEELGIKAKKATDEKQKSSYSRAEQALERTIAWVNVPMALYQEGTINIETLKQSVTKLLNTDAAKKEMKIINTHRGSKQAWVEFIGAIFTVGISLIYKALNGYSLFNVNTDTANRLEEFKDSISNANLIYMIY